MPVEELNLNYGVLFTFVLEVKATVDRIISVNLPFLVNLVVHDVAVDNLDLTDYRGIQNDPVLVNVVKVMVVPTLKVT